MNKIILILLCSSGYFIKAQNSLLNEAKYWMWRDRLVNDWMVPNFTGDYTHKGRGIVFKDRGIGECNFYDTITNTTIRIDGGFDISDEGFEMGKYLIVLATEWRLLFNSGLSTQQTEAEIYWALKTIDRLDYDAETYWSYFWSRGQETWGGQRNGFMIRDDVKSNFLWYSQEIPYSKFLIDSLDKSYGKILRSNYNIDDSKYFYFVYNEDSYFNYRYLNQGINNKEGKYYPRNIMVSSIDGSRILTLSEQINALGSRFSAYENGLWACYGTNKESVFRNYHWTGPEEYSQDNYIGLLQGLVAVEQFVNSDVNVNGNGLSSYAAHIIDRIIYSVKNNESFNDNWVIDNPITGKCVKGLFWHDIINKVIDNHNNYHENKLNYGCEDGGANAGYFSRLLKLVHQYYTSHCSDCHNNNDIGNQVVLHELPNKTNRALLLAILQTLDNVSALKSILGDKILHVNTNDESLFLPYRILESHASEANFHEFRYLDLLYAWLHNKETYKPFQYYEDIINNTPCLTNEQVDQFPVNLLSEMIIHNLLKILKGEKYNYFIKDDKTYPYPSFSPPGSFNHCLICNAYVVTFNKIESSAIISSQEYQNFFGGPCKANVTYKAGKEIHLKPGFKVINGAKFHGYIEPMNVCQIKEGNPDVAVLFFPPSDEHISTYVSNLNYTKIEIDDNIDEEKNGIFKNDILLIPNPAIDFINLKTNDDNIFQLKIYNMVGQLVEKSNIKSNENISVNHLKRGVYIFKIFKQNELVQIQKIVLQ